MAKVEYMTKYKRKKIGMCSGWLCEAQVGEPVYFWIRKGTLAFPRDVTTPVICIGPGIAIISKTIMLMNCIRNWSCANYIVFRRKSL